MANQMLRKRLINEIQRMIAEGKTASLEPHNGVAGDWRDENLKKVLRLVIPDTAKVGTGKISDVNDGHSSQTDIIVHAPGLLPASLTKESEGYFPIDAVIYAIEVKTTLDAGELKKAIEDARALQRLKYASPPDDDPEAPYPPVVSLLFAYGSDLTTSSIEAELRRYGKYDQDWCRDPAIAMICVAGVGMCNFRWNLSPDATTHLSGCWHYRSDTSDHDAVIDFLSVIANGINETIDRRGRPRPGAYFIQPRAYRFMYADGATKEAGGFGQ